MKVLFHVLAAAVFIAAAFYAAGLVASLVVAGVMLMLLSNEVVHGFPAMSSKKPAAEKKPVKKAAKPAPKD